MPPMAGRPVKRSLSSDRKGSIGKWIVREREGFERRCRPGHQLVGRHQQATGMTFAVDQYVVVAVAGDEVARARRARQLELHGRFAWLRRRARIEGVRPLP